MAQGISSLLQQLGFSNIKIFTNGVDVVKACLGTKPQYVFLDIYMAQGDGLTALQTLRTKGFTMPILMLSMTAEKIFIDNAIAYGANAYIHKSCDAAEIDIALQSIAQSNIYISDVANSLKNTAVKVNINSEYYLSEALTKREVEILRLYCDGLNTDEIATKLFLSSATVDTHKKKIMGKFGVNSLSKLIAVAFKNYFV